MRHFKQHQSRPKKSRLIAGESAVMRSMDEGVEIERIFVLENRNNRLLQDAAAKAGVPVSKVPLVRLNRFNVPDHNGVIALKSNIAYQDLQNVISWVVERGEMPSFLLLDGITDIRNIGAIARTAYCCGVHALVIPQKGVATLNEDSMLTSGGALEHIAVCRVTDLKEAVGLLQLNGIRVFASEMTSPKDIFQIDFTGPSAIIMGSEDKGISSILYEEVDDTFRIPMFHHFESLNVSVAAGMILYESMRQRSKRP